MAAGRCNVHDLILRRRVSAVSKDGQHFKAVVRNARKSALLTMRTLTGKDHFP
jgi:hypothetical protein